jgi:choline-sulfatase
MAGAGVTRYGAHVLGLAAAALMAACGGGPREPGAEPAAGPAPRPSILLVTLDTTRADAIGPEAHGIETPAFDAIAARGRRFRQAYATVPETLPSHSSMMTGLLASGHGVHENARPLSRDHSLLSERLGAAGYETAAFVSAFVLDRRFGLARGFSVYDDERPERGVERTAEATTTRALAWLDRGSKRPVFVWVHYFDPHAPYAPPEPYRSRFADRPYLGEVAAMDEQLGRLVDGFTRAEGEGAAIVVVGDHGEGLGDHGEPQHGNLLYQSTMHVPLVLAGPGVAPGTVDTPVSTRRVFHTVLDWAGLGSAESLRHPGAEVVLAEAMRPFLAFGWQPQVMAVSGHTKVILAGRPEVYDLDTDPGETRDLGASHVPPALLAAVHDYPVPRPGGNPADLTPDERQKLASLGYLAADVSPVVRADAPRPVDMAGLFELVDHASALFVREEYARAIPLYEKIRAADPGNLDALLRLATAHSALGHDAQARAAFDAAARLAPDSLDVRTYRALHDARGPQWREAVPVLEEIVRESPDRLPALEALAVLRQRQGRVDDAIALREKVYDLRRASGDELVQLGEMAMSRQRTDLAIRSFERAREAQGSAFAHDLELGVLYLAARRLPEARAALDRVGPTDPRYPMALFKRAQVSVLLEEPDAPRRIAAARDHADATTRPLIARERLFQGR